MYRFVLSESSPFFLTLSFDIGSVAVLQAPCVTLCVHTCLPFRQCCCNAAVQTRALAEGFRGPQRAYRNLLLMLHPDVSLLIYAYFFLLLYVSAAALTVILVPRPPPGPPVATPALAPHPRTLLTGASARNTWTGLEAAVWLPLVAALHRVSGLTRTTGLAVADDSGTLLIGTFLVSLGLPLVLLVWVTASNPASSTILHPAKFMRPTVSNLLVLSATVAEALQLSASTFQVRAWRSIVMCMCSSHGVRGAYTLTLHAQLFERPGTAGDTGPFVFLWACDYVCCHCARVPVQRGI